MKNGTHKIQVLFKFSNDIIFDFLRLKKGLYESNPYLSNFQTSTISKLKYFFFLKIIKNIFKN